MKTKILIIFIIFFISCKKDFTVKTIPDTRVAGHEFYETQTFTQVKALSDYHTGDTVMVRSVGSDPTGWKREVIDKAKFGDRGNDYFINCCELNLEEVAVIQ